MADIKASDLLLEITEKLTSIDKMLKLNDFQQKMIIKTLNKLVSSGVVATSSQTQNDAAIPNNVTGLIDDEYQFTTINPESIADKKKRLMKIQTGNLAADQNFPPDYISQEQMEDDENKNNPKEFNVSKRSKIATPILRADNYDALNNEDLGKLVPITQRIVGGTNNIPMSNSNIIIKDESGNVIKTAKTNQQGRWNLALPIGKYTFNVSGFNVKHGNFAFEQTFAVPPIDSVLELPHPQIYFRK